MSSVSLAREQALYGAQSQRTLATLRRDLAQIQEQSSTGLRVNRASDDPSAFGQARALEALERRYAQYERSIGAARLWTDHTQSALDHLAELLTQAGEEGIRALNGTHSADNHADIAGRIEALLAETVDGLNVKVNGEYLFGGTRTNAAPVDADGNATGDLSGERIRQVGPEIEFAVNVPGSRVLDTGEGFTITEALRDLALVLRDPANAPVPLEEAVGRVQTARDHLIERGAEAGNIANRLDLVAEQMREGQLLAAGRRSELEDADYLELATRLQRTQTSLEAALKVTATTLGTTLLDYLR